jgi:predicted amidohydrolase
VGEEMKFTVALLQIAPLGSDQNGNLAKGIQFCRRAKGLGADLVAFPELWNIGMCSCPIDAEGRSLWTASAIDRKSSFFRSFIAVAQELDMSIAITYLEAHEPKPRNTVSIINRQGDVVLNYSKVFICDFGADELLKPNPNVAEVGCDVNCSPGSSFDVCTLDCAEGQVRVGAMICADREFPKPANELMLNGAEVIIVPNACTWDEIRTAGLKTRAFENLVGVAMANYPNNGNSQAYTCVAWKEGQGGKDTLIAKAGEQEEILVVQFDMDEIRAFRKAEAWRLDHQRFHAGIR